MNCIQKKLNNELKKIPLFVKDLEGELHIICGLSTDFKIEKDFKLVYLGKPFDWNRMHLNTL